MDEHLVQSTLNYHRFANPGNISITPTMRMHSDRDNETTEEATSQKSLLIEEEESIWANIPALGATSRVGT